MSYFSLEAAWTDSWVMDLNVSTCEAAGWVTLKGEPRKEAQPTLFRKKSIKIDPSTELWPGTAHYCPASTLLFLNNKTWVLSWPRATGLNDNIYHHPR